jgi:hypothetical protein
MSKDVSLEGFFSMIRSRASTLTREDIDRLMEKSVRNVRELSEKLKKIYRLPKSFTRFR